MIIQLDTPWSTLALTSRAQSRLELVQKLQEKWCLYNSVCKSFLRLIFPFFLLHNLSKHYSVRFMTPFLCNSSPISQKGGVAVLCPVVVLGTFPYFRHYYLAIAYSVDYGPIDQYYTKNIVQPKHIFSSMAAMEYWYFVSLNMYNFVLLYCCK